jgi:RNA polymerase sigma factor (TIGR02999 family)
MPGEVTQLLHAIDEGDPKAAEELLPLVYDELRRVAATKMANEKPGQTLQPTALVHEAWLKLMGNDESEWRDRTHFIHAAAEAMRRILVDRARHKLRAKRGGGWVRESCETIDLAQPTEDERLLLVHEALDELSREQPLQAQVVKLRYFVGLNHSETAGALGLSEKTVRRYWNYAKLRLFQEIKSRQ